MKKQCKITFRSSKVSRFVKGENYTILPAVGLPGVKLFQVEHTNGETFLTDEAHINKFFI